MSAEEVLREAHRFINAQGWDGRGSYATFLQEKEHHLGRLDAALASLVPAVPSEDGLVVTFIDPNHLLLWLEDGEIAGEITMDEGLKADGMIRVWRNDPGAPMVDVTEVLTGDMVSRTLLGNIRRIEVL